MGDNVVLIDGVHGAICTASLRLCEEGTSTGAEVNACGASSALKMTH